MDTLGFVTDIIGALKNLKRTGWVRQGVPIPESDADHMHRCAMLAMMVQDDSINSTKLLRMALTHDVCESIAGDITPHCKDKLHLKYEKEKAAMEQIRVIVGDPLGKELFDLWKEYEEQETKESIYCKDIDKFEMVVQAYEYEKMHLKPFDQADKAKKDVTNEPLRDFFQSTNDAIRTPFFRKLDKELREKREAMLKEKGWTVTDDEQQRPPKRPLEE
jgi:putative hydrolases of HD superfamily